MTVRKAIALRSRLLIVCPSGLNPGFNKHTWSRLVNVGKELASCLNPVQGGVAVGMLDPYDWIALWQLNLSRNPSLIFNIITTNVRHIMWVNVIFWDQCFATQAGPVFATHPAGGRGSLYQITPAVKLSQQESCYPANSMCTKSSAALHKISWKVKVEEVLKLCSAWCGCYWGRCHLKVLSRLLYFPPLTMAAIIIGGGRK